MRKECNGNGTKNNLIIFDIAREPAEQEQALVRKYFVESLNQVFSHYAQLVISEIS